MSFEAIAPAPFLRLFFQFPLEGSHSSASTPHASATLSKRQQQLPKPSPLKTASARSAGPPSASHKSGDPSTRSGASSLLAKPKISKTSAVGKPVKSFTSSDATRSTTSTGKKRSRSLSRSESPPPAKKRANYRDEIWQILGKNRSNYVSIDVFSDDEDMEADTTLLEKEEEQRLRLRFMFVVLSLTTRTLLVLGLQRKKMCLPWKKKNVTRMKSADERRRGRGKLRGAPARCNLDLTTLVMQISHHLHPVLKDPPSRQMSMFDVLMVHSHSLSYMDGLRTFTLQL